MFKIFGINFLILFIGLILYTQITSIFLQDNFFYLLIIIFFASLIIAYIINRIIILPKDLNLAILETEFCKSSDDTKIKNHQKSFELELLNTALQEKLKKQRELSEILQEKLDLEIALKEKKEVLLKKQSKLVSIAKIAICMVDKSKESISNLKVVLEDINNKSINNSIEELKKIVIDMEFRNDELKNFIEPNEQKSEFYLDKVVMEVLKTLDDIFIGNNIKVDYNISKSILCYGISSQFRQVIFNIFENAKDALLEKNTPSKKIFVRIKKDKEFSYISIMDNAGGIQEDNISKIFEANFTTKSDKNASGLGLFISKIVIEENMQGKLEFENINQGARFTIKIPSSTV